MSRHVPCIDVNLFVFNGQATLSAAIESVLAQSWPALHLTLIDNGSTDQTPQIAQRYASRSDRVTLRRNRVNAGAVLNCQRAFWYGDADFVMPKTADDLLDPDFITQVMGVMLSNPDCAMCHAAGLVFADADAADPMGHARHYPFEHRLHAIGPDPLQRSRIVMRDYTSAPSFWGIYRRSATDRLSPIPYRAGWDHTVLAELALYGEIRHIDAPLFWRRNGGRHVDRLAPTCTAHVQRGLPPGDPLADLKWLTPLITTTYAHMEMFALARIGEADRRTMMRDAGHIFRARWPSLLVQEATAFRRALPALVGAIAREGGMIAGWMAGRLREAVQAIEAVLPEQDFSAALQEIDALVGVLRAQPAS
jgi:hypothetical protein